MRIARAAGSVAALAGLSLLAAGCYGGKTWEAVQRIQLQTAELDSLSRVQRADLNQLRQDFAKQSEFLRSTKADTDVRVAELARRLDVVVGKLEDNNERFSEVLQRFDVGRRLPAVRDTGAAGRDSSGAAIGVPPGGGGGGGAGGDPKSLYDAAYSDYVAGRYDLARAGFQQYVLAYDQTELAGNAQFWIGETYYQQHQYPEAAAAYQKVLDKFPHNIKYPAAMLKLGLSQAGIGDRAAARATLRRVARSFPGTEEARVAQQRLRSL